MRKLLRVASFLFYPAPYPIAGVYHFMVGAALRWWLKFGAPHDYRFIEVVKGGALGIVVGVLGVILFGYLLARAEEKAK